MKLFSRKKRDETADVDGHPDSNDQEAAATKPKGFFRRKPKPEAALPAEDRVEESKSKKPKRKAPAKKMKRSKSRLSAADIYMESRGVIVFGNKKAAIDLNWIAIDDGVKPRVKINEINSSSETQYRAFTFLQDSDMAALASRERGQKKGMRALVTAMDEELAGERWLGAFQIDTNGELWWIASIRDGAIFSDQIFRSRSEAESQFIDYLKAPDWTTIFAPSEWDIADTRNEPLHILFDPARGQKLRSLRPVRDALPYAIVFLTLAGLIGGTYGFLEYRKAEKQRYLEDMRNKAAQAAIISPKDYPWYDTPNLSEFIERCTEEINNSILIVPGWEQKPIACSLNSRKSGVISTGWANKNGRFSWLRSAVGIDQPQPSLDRSGSNAGWQHGFDLSPDNSDIGVEPWNSADVFSLLTERFQNNGLSITIRDDPQNRSVANTKPVFNSQNVRMTSPVGFSGYVKLLQDVPALLPDALVYNIETNSWDMTLKVFNPPIIPETPPPNYR